MAIKIDLIQNDFIKKVWEDLPLPSSDYPDIYRAVYTARWAVYCKEAKKRFPKLDFDPTNSMSASQAFALILNPNVDVGLK